MNAKHTSKPTVSVIILSHNYGHDLARAVRSVFEQKRPPIEVVILDVGSDDNTWEVAQEIAKDSPPIPVRLERLPNVGPSVARNRGAALTHGEFLVFLDADDYLSPAFLTKTVPRLQEAPDASLVYAISQMFGEETTQWAVEVYDFQRLCRNNIFNYCVLLRRSAFKQVGGFDEDNFGYYEDWELWIRLGKHGWDAIHIPEPLFFYHSHSTTSLMSYSKRLDPVYRAYIVARHPDLYTAEQVASARQALGEAPAGWHKRPPMKGLDNMQRLAEQFPDNRHILYFLALAYAHECRHTAAATALKHLLELYPGDQDANAALRKVQLLAPYSDGQTEATRVHMVQVKTYLHKKDLLAARNKLACCFGDRLGIHPSDSRLKQLADVAIHHVLDVSDDWQQLAEYRERRVQKLRNWINRLNRGKDRLEQQWKYWERKAKNDKNRSTLHPAQVLARILGFLRPKRRQRDKTKTVGKHSAV